MHVTAPSSSAARRLAAAASQPKVPQTEPGAGPASRSPVQEQQHAGSLSAQSSALSRLSSVNASSSTNTRTTSAFYSAHSYFIVDASSEALSFHTAEHQAVDVGGESAQRMASGGEAADEAFAHAIAKQYVLDAEAAGSYAPSQRSRALTAGGPVVGSDRLTTSASEDAAPQLPGLGYMVGRDYESSMDSEKRGVGERRAYERSLSEKTESRPDSEDRAMSQRLRDEEVEDDANEASHFVSAWMRYPAPQYTVRADGAVPMGAVLFAAGFLILPLWWLGVLLPRNCDTPVARTWRKYNALMSLLSLPLLALLLALGGWQATHD